MTEFCKQCAEEIGFSPDFVGLSTKEDTDKGIFCAVLCEGCGLCQVDHEGKCVSINCSEQHGKNVITQNPEKHIMAMHYINYKDVHSFREVIPIRFFFGTTEFYQAPQWLMEAYDTTKEANRIFAMAKMRIGVAIQNDPLSNPSTSETHN